MFECSNRTADSLGFILMEGPNLIPITLIIVGLKRWADVTRLTQTFRLTASVMDESPESVWVVDTRSPVLS